MTRDAGRATDGRERRTSRAAFVLALVLSLAACATPVAPTGGPEDRTPPRLVASSPAADAVGVDGRTVRLSFSERVDAASALRAVTVTPEPGPGEPVPRVEASADEIVVTLPALRDSTTYVVTVGTELADRRGVRLPAPLTLAFSTGPELDRGEIAGTVRLPTDGAGVAGLSVFAYRVSGDSLPDPRTARPDARTQTDAQGAFRLGYLADVPHFVAALRDLNRNGRADDGEPFAAPPAPRLRPTQPAVSFGAADTLGAPLAGSPFQQAALGLWLARRDTVPPEIRTVRALSDRRFRVRFSEGVRLPEIGPADGPPDRAEVWDSLRTDRLSLARAFVAPDRADELEVWAQAPILPGVARLNLPTVVDSAGLFTVGLSPTFTVPGRADTLVTRFVRFEPSPPAPDSAVVLYPDAQARPDGRSLPAVVLTGPSDRGAEVVIAYQSEGRVRRDTVQANGTRVALCLGGAVGTEGCSGIVAAVPGGIPVSATVLTADTTATVRFDLPPPESLGSVSAALPVAESRPDGLGFVVVELSGPVERTRAGEVGTPVAFGGLPPGTYRARAWRDESASNPVGTWSGGSLAPYLPPEPLVILAEPVEVRARWDTEIDAALLAPLFDATPPDAAAPAPDR